MVRIPVSEPQQETRIANLQDVAGTGWGAPGRAMQQLGSAISGLSGVFEGMAKEQNALAEQNDNLTQLQYEGAKAIAKTEFDNKFTGTSADYIPGFTAAQAAVDEEYAPKFTTQRGQQRFAISRQEHTNRNTVYGMERAHSFAVNETVTKTQSESDRIFNDAITPREGETLSYDTLAPRIKTATAATDAMINGLPIPEDKKAMLRKEQADKVLDFVGQLRGSKDLDKIELGERLLKDIVTNRGASSGGFGQDQFGGYDTYKPPQGQRMNLGNPEAPQEQSSAAPDILSPKVTAYSPRKGGDSMEGGYASSKSGPDGKSEVRTLADVAAGRSDHVTLAGDPSQYGKTYTIPSITFRDASGKEVTLENVKGVVHDTGSAFKGAGDTAFDIPVDKDLTDEQMNTQPFLKAGVQFQGERKAQQAQAGKLPKLTIAQIPNAEKAPARPRDAKIEGVVIHHTSGPTLSSAINTSIEKGNGANYYVDRDGSVHLWVPEDKAIIHIREPGSRYRNGANANLRNSNTIGIEVVARNDKDITPQQRQALQALLKDIASRNNIDPKNVVGHGEIQGGPRGNREDDEGKTAALAFREGRDDGAPMVAQGNVPVSQRGVTQYAGLGGPTPGLIEPGNIDLEKRKVLNNPDGSISTESSFSVNVDGMEVLLPSVIDGKRVSEEEAIAHFKKTGEHLGKFDSPDNATAYAKSLHEQQGERYSSENRIRVADASGAAPGAPRSDAFPNTTTGVIMHTARDRAQLSDQAFAAARQEAEEVWARERMLKVKELQDNNTGGYKLNEKTVEFLRQEIAKRPEIAKRTGLTAQFDQVVRLGQILDYAKALPPDQFTQFLNTWRADMANGTQITPFDKSAFEAVDKLHKEMVETVRKDAYEWEERIGSTIDPIVFPENVEELAKDPRALALFQQQVERRAAIAAEIQKKYGVDQVLRPQERDQLMNILSKGGDNMTNTITAIVDTAGPEAAKKIFGELKGASPQMAWLGDLGVRLGSGLPNSGSIVRDLAKGIELKMAEKKEGAEKARITYEPKEKELIPVVRDVLGQTNLEKGEVDTIVNLATTAYTIRAARQYLDEFNPDLFKQTLKDVLGENAQTYSTGNPLSRDVATVSGKFGGFFKQWGLFDNGNVYDQGPTIIIPHYVNNERMGAIQEAISLEDIALAGLGTPLDDNGLPVPIERIRSGYLVQVGDPKEGKYLVSIGDPKKPGAEQFLHLVPPAQGEKGKPFVIEMDKLAPVMAERHPTQKDWFYNPPKRSGPPLVVGTPGSPADPDNKVNPYHTTETLRENTAAVRGAGNTLLDRISPRVMRMPDGRVGMAIGRTEEEYRKATEETGVTYDPEVYRTIRRYFTPKEARERLDQLEKNIKASEERRVARDKEAR